MKNDGGTYTPEQLEDIANELRAMVIRMLEHAGSGHPGGALGLAEIYATMYFDVLRHDPNNPEWDERDMFVVSNGHTAPILYATLAKAGYFAEHELSKLRQFGSRLQGHPEHAALPGVETTSGPLGSGLSQAAGMALSLKMDKNHQRWVYCVTGDGELNEGNIWEAAMLAAKYKLYNLTAIVDRNSIQIDGNTESVMPLESLKDKWEAFGWHVLEINGHSPQALIEATQMAKSVIDKPVVIIAYTIPGKGVDFMQYEPKWHGTAPDSDQAKQALKMLHTLNGAISEDLI